MWGRGDIDRGLRKRFRFVFFFVGVYKGGISVRVIREDYTDRRVKYRGYFF